MNSNGKKILIIGGAGFIGSACVRLLSQEGYECIVFDNLESGRANAVNVPLIQGDIRNKDQLNAVFGSFQIDAVIHLAAKIKPTESIEKPKLYFEVNTIGSLNVAHVMVQHGVRDLIFSSTAAVYGNHPYSLTEESVCTPTTPYGQSKKEAELGLLKMHTENRINLSILRFFNAAGAMPNHNVGEVHHPEIHLIPKIIRSIKENKAFAIYGNKHPTKDGTCIRDFVHVRDIAQAHCLLIKSHLRGKNGDIFNVGSGKGHSVLEVYQEIRRQMNSENNYIIEAKRIGDPSILMTCSDKLQGSHKWSPNYSTLERIVTDAIKWADGINS